MNTLFSNIAKPMVASLAAVMLNGCVAIEGKETDLSKYKMTPPPEHKVVTKNNGAIYQANTSQPLFEDNRARRVGDIITIVLTESTAASKSASTNTSKESKTDSRGATILGKTLGTNPRRDLLGNNIDSTHEFAGSGDSSQSNSLNGTISVTVAKVYANGNLFVRGMKRITLNNGVEYIKISGIVRASDVSSSNTVQSKQLANARIIYSGKGSVANSNKMGWLMKFFNSPIWPF